MTSTFDGINRWFLNCFFAVLQLQLACQGPTSNRISTGEDFGPGQLLPFFTSQAISIFPDNLARQEERMEEALKTRQGAFEQDVIGCLNEIKVLKTDHGETAFAS